MNDTDDAETDPETGTVRIEGAAEARARTELEETETESHRGGNTVVEVGMWNGVISGRASGSVLA